MKTTCFGVTSCFDGKSAGSASGAIISLSLRRDAKRHGGNGRAGTEAYHLTSQPGFHGAPLDGLARGQRLRPSSFKADTPEVTAINILLIRRKYDGAAIRAESDIFHFKRTWSEQCRRAA